MFESKKIEVTRRCQCGACGEDITRGQDRTQVVMPWQIRGINYHTECLENFVCDNAKGDTTSIGSSVNCMNHTVTIYTNDPIIGQYFIKYGFKPFERTIHKGLNVGLRARFENAESIGATIKTAFNTNCEVFINGHKCKTLADYDARTKEICMR